MLHFSLHRKMMILLSQKVNHLSSSIHFISLHELTQHNDRIPLPSLQPDNLLGFLFCHTVSLNPFENHIWCELSQSFLLLVRDPITNFMPKLFDLEDHSQRLELFIYLFEHLMSLYMLSPKSIALLALNFLYSQLLQLHLFFLDDVPFNQQKGVVLVLLVDYRLFVHHALQLLGVLADPLLEE